MKLRRLLAAAGAATLLGCLVAPPALAAGPAVTVTPSAGLDPAGTSITVKGTGFAPAANDGKGFGVRVGPAKDDVRVRTATGFQVSKLVKKDAVGTQIPLGDDGTWELTVSVKAEYTSAGTTYSAKTQPFSVYVFGWDTPDLTWDRTTPLKFTGLGAPDPGTSPTGLAWGIKQSWRAYIARFGGTIAADQGATLDEAAPNTAPFPYRWPAGKAIWDGQKGSVAFGGRAVFTLEPHLIWQFSLANPKITLAGDGTGKLSATVGYQFYGTKTAPEQVRKPSEVDFADLAVKSVGQDGDNVVVELASAKLTEAGAGAFAGFYPAGTDLDAGKLVFPAPGDTPPTSNPPTSTPPTSTTPPPACTLSPGAVAQGNLLWGFKKSFRSYVGGGTGNTITASGGAEVTTVDEVAGKAIPTGAYRFALGGGTLTSDTEFTAAFTGKVVFSYPAHFFTLTLANPKVTVAGGKGTLYADVDLQTTAGAPSPPVSKPGVALANLDLASAVKTPDDGTLTLSAIKATLTSADAFANFYQAGDVLDEPTVTLAAQCATLPGAGGANPGGPAGTGSGSDLVPDVAFRPSNLASTGVSLTGVYWGTALLLAGGGLVLLTRRRALRK